jgi:bifunctional non-homologous end joining protein LigD
MWSEDAQREIDYFVCDDEASLLYIVNLGTIPLHLWASRVGSLEKPDWFVLDLDPKEAPFAHVVEIARALRHLCEEIELPSFIKTSGSSGLHVLVPLGGQCSYEQARSLAEVLAQMMVAELPKIATLVRAVSKREGKVYLDYIQNGAGRLLAAPFCVRPLPGAPVSAPLEWSEVTQRLDIGRFTIETMPKRMAKLGRDPLLPLLELKPDLGRALALLAARADGGKGVKKGGNKKRGRGEGESRAGTKKAG